MLINYTNIEQYILTELDPLKTTHGVKTLEIYSGQLENEFSEIISLFPAVYVVCSNADFEPKNMMDITNATIEIMCCDRDIRLTGEARQGAHGLVLGVRELLNRNNLSKTGVLFIKRERLIFWHPINRIAVMGANYEFKTMNYK